PPVEAAFHRDDPRPGFPAEFAREFEGRLHRFGAGVGEEDPALGVRPGMTEEPFSEADLGGGGEEVRYVPEGVELRCDRAGEGGVGVTEGVDGDTCEEGEVLVAVGVPDVGPFTTNKHPLRRAEGVHQRVGVTFPPLGLGDSGPGVGDIGHLWGTSGSIIVPTPWVVKISRSREWGTRPSTTCAEATPPRTARRHASIFGTIPDSRFGRICASSSAFIREMREDLSGQFAYSPSTSVRMTSFSARRATASAAAAVSALTLSTSPGVSTSGAIVETTGMHPASSIPRTIEALTRTTSPTSPTSTGSPSTSAWRRRAPKSPASSPEIPTASASRRLSWLTSARWTCPVRSEEHTSELQSRFDLVCRLLFVTNTIRE